LSNLAVSGGLILGQIDLSILNYKEIDGIKVPLRFELGQRVRFLFCATVVALEVVEALIHQHQRRLWAHLHIKRPVVDFIQIRKGKEKKKVAFVIVPIKAHIDLGCCELCC